MGMRTMAFVAVLAVASGPAGAADDAKHEAPRFGQVAKGLRIALSSDRRVLCPGETLQLRGYFWNVSSDRLSLPLESGWPAGELHVKTPAGDVFTFGRRSDRKWPEEKSHGVRAGAIDWLRQMHLRVMTGPEGWFAKAPAKSAPLTLGKEGTYSAWIVYEVPEPEGAGGRGWSGKAVSNVLTFTVRAMPPAKRSQKPTARQRTDLEMYVRGNDVDKRRQAYARLKPALMLTENEGLALAVLAELKKHPRRASDRCPPWWNNLFYCLVLRTGDPIDAREVGIAGPCAKGLAEFVMDSLDGPAGQPSIPSWVGQWAVNPVAAYVKLHPEDTKLRDRLAAMAKADARAPAETKAATRPDAETKPAGAAPKIGRATAWKILLELGVLRDGMTPEQAAEILGKPADRDAKHIGWYIETPKHVNPYLVAELAEGKLVKWKVSSR
jgi:hypothetical protein